MNTHQKLQSNLNDIESGNKISEKFNFKTKQNNYCLKLH